MTTPRGPLVLHLGLIRTGTASMAQAYDDLGYRNVYHGLRMMERAAEWVLLEKAAEASFPHATPPGDRSSLARRPWTRADWDQLFGDCDVVTDIGSFFAQELIEAYPEAKVVIVERDYDKWWHSVEVTTIYALWSLPARVFIEWIEPITGSRSGPAVRKMMLGFFRADDVDELRRNAKERYFEHYRQMRDMVPPERLLEFKLGQGWGPLCAFLDREEPGTEFPRTNDAEQLRKIAWARLWRYSRLAVVVVGKYVVGSAVVGAGVVLLARFALNLYAPAV